MNRADIACIFIVVILLTSSYIVVFKGVVSMPDNSNYTNKDGLIKGVKMVVDIYKNQNDTTKKNNTLQSECADNPKICSAIKNMTQVQEKLSAKIFCLEHQNDQRLYSKTIVTVDDCVNKLLK